MLGGEILKKLYVLISIRALNEFFSFAQILEKEGVSIEILNKYYLDSPLKDRVYSIFGGVL